MTRAWIAALALLLAGPCLAQDRVDVEDFCARAGKNRAIYEQLSLLKTSAKPGAELGAVRCRWTFSRLDKADIVVALDSRLLKAPILARQMILLARMPENHRGQTIEPLPRLGDDGLSRAIVQQGITRRFEIEAAKGRRHFLLTVQASDGSDIDYRLAAASVDFLSGGLAALEKP